MPGLFHGTRGAFAPFYADEVSVVGARGGRTLRGTYRACVFAQGLDAQIGDESVDSHRRRITISIPRGEDGWIGGRPQIGDEVKGADGVKFRVDAVSCPLGDAWEMEARQV